MKYFLHWTAGDTRRGDRNGAAEEFDTLEQLKVRLKELEDWYGSDFRFTAVEGREITDL